MIIGDWMSWLLGASKQRGLFSGECGVEAVGFTGSAGYGHIFETGITFQYNSSDIA